MDSERKSLRRQLRFGSGVMDFSCTFLLACALLCTTPLRGENIYSTAAVDPSEIVTEDAEIRQQTAHMRERNLRDFHSPVEGSDISMTAETEMEARGAGSWHPCCQLEDSSNEEHVTAYAAEKPILYETEVRHQRLRGPTPEPYPRRSSPSGSPTFPLNPVFGEITGQPKVRSLQDVRFAPWATIAHESLGGTEADDDGDDDHDHDEPLPAKWTSAEDIEEEGETLLTEVADSDAALLPTESQGDDVQMEAAHEDEIVSSQHHKCKKKSCGYIPVVATPVAPVYPLSVIAPFSFAPVPVVPYPPAAYNAWPGTYPYFPYYGSFANQNSWYSTSLGSTVTQGGYGGGYNGWSVMGYPYTW